MPVTASADKKAFSCPRCGAYANQTWISLAGSPLRKFAEPAAPTDFYDEKAELSGEFALGPIIKRSPDNSIYIVENTYLSHCTHCNGSSIWLGDRLIYPEASSAPPLNPDTPAEIAVDYNEAALILHHSPRGAAALLRLAIQKLCESLGESGRNINSDIASLVAKGLDQRIQKALDVLRVVGNEAVHPGTIDLNDDPAIAESLFRLFNLIVEKMISEPKHVDEVYALLPKDKLDAINRRDGK